MSKYFSCLLIFSLFLSLSSYADVIFELNYKGSGQNKAGKSVFSIKGDNLRMDFYQNGENPENSMIYRGGRNEIVTLDHSNKSYFVMDKKTMASMAGQMNQAMSQLEEAFKDMDPAQRAMMEKMMKGKMPTMNKASNNEPVLKRSGSVEVNGYACEKVDVYNDGEKVQQFCVTKWDNIKGGN
ncbi:MAG: hypothetical protein ACUZ8H_06325, partial [Candidatus Anammoxibacter sp.]